MHWFRRWCCWQWAFGGLGSGTRIQFYGNWLKDKLFFALPPLLFHCPPQSTREEFLLLSSMAHRQHMILGHPAVPQKLLMVPLSSPPEAAAVESAHPK